MKRFLARTWFWLALAVAWTLPWGIYILDDLRAHTALGSGTAGSLDAYEVAEAVFVAAHGGIRMLAGLALLAVAWGGLELWRRRSARGREAGAERPGAGSAGQAVAGD